MPGMPWRLSRFFIRDLEGSTSDSDSSDHEIQKIVKRPIMWVPEGAEITRAGDKEFETVMSAQGFTEDAENEFTDDDDDYWYNSLGIKNPAKEKPVASVSLMPREAATTKDDTKRRGTKRRGPWPGDKTNVTPPWRRQRQPSVVQSYAYRGK